MTRIFRTLSAGVNADVACRTRTDKLKNTIQAAGFDYDSRKRKTNAWFIREKGWLVRPGFFSGAATMAVFQLVCSLFDVFFCK